jgi:RES domain-containing protein
VYASTCEPLALLEKLVHFAGLRRPAYSLYIADLPAASLPPDWRSIYPPPSTQQLGSNWLASKSAAGLLVPSVLISGADPRIKNCLLNPEHPGYAHAKFSGPIPLAIDPRF